MHWGDIYIWLDKDDRQIGIRSSNQKTGSQPLEVYLNKRFRFLPDFSIRDSEAETNDIELRLSFAWMWLSFYCLLHTRPEEKGYDVMNEGKQWGWSFFMDSIHMHWGSWTKLWHIPFIAPIFERRQLLSLDRSTIINDEPAGKRESPCDWEAKEALRATVSETHPYTYTLKRGEVQKRNATIYVERMIHRYKWTPIRRVREYIDVRFDGEVGERSGSWKGGCTGCSYSLNPGETPLECLRRMERERKFT